MSFLRPNSEAVQPRPSSEMHARHLSSHQTRPSSDILHHQKSAEAVAIDRWFEDLSYYEQTLEQMAKTKLDDNFREELMAIEQWFTVLSEPERTTALYSLSLHTSPVQVRFLSTVLTQMSNKSEKKSNSIPAGTPGSSLTGNPRVEVTSHDGLLPPGPIKLSHNAYDPFSSSTNPDPINSPLLRPRTPSEEAINSADWSMNPPAIPMRSQSPSPHVTVPSRNSSLDTKGLNNHPGQGWDHLDFDKLRVGDNVHQNFDYQSDYSGQSDYEGDFDGGSQVGHREKGRIPDAIDVSVLNDIPAWFRSLRLHKYTPLFEKDNWRDIVQLDDAGLVRKGVAALGARRKMLKVFEMVRGELLAKNIRL